MSSNSRGSYRTTRQNAMKAFDKLPPKARAALANAAFNWAAQPVLTKLGADISALTTSRSWWRFGIKIGLPKTASGSGASRLKHEN